ncbi:hypothetical protein BBO99_00002801 [Phytophthora kernoviae]|uniref:Uncharacterized protein n=2 Tax=Phytophthora kernoviae TaxID=325452 RepID=A0A3R7J9Q8_9STRA|nr:hypothetical protein G195_003275 [Phytophthora kernoviae 00238/432]KAG2524612.1 hypothetical protein JM16_002192 [Phytophthora kernoviae]KAG2527878.1 hypothetical protein JM18_003514 [Phytophthora kernoviae]RLN44041.1 hypothetical protein BBI17_002711 [Phytophthora kernoviae]RLN82572.1 hypothetical protein BBO99_00002801 [Phytophthora kernoviae]
MVIKKLMELPVNHRAFIIAVLIVLFGLTFGLLLDANEHIPKPFNRISSIIGWIYFFCWSVSFYPQVFLNQQRQSVVGLSLDYTVLNMLGFTCYSIFNCAFYYTILFAGAVVVTGDDEDSSINTLNFLYLLSYVKLMTTLVKCLPQIVLNYQRKSTVGWTIWNVLLDIAGGMLSIGQQVLDSAATHDWTAMTGDPVKFSLGFVSIIVDIVFILQHYVLYAENNNFMLHGGEAQPFLPK